MPENDRLDGCLDEINVPTFIDALRRKGNYWV
jgi:hypothetical protein